MSGSKTLSPGVRWALVIGLWVVLAVVLTFSVRNFGWLGTVLPGILYACFSACAVVIVFSLVAAAIHLSVDTIRGKYPE